MIGTRQLGCIVATRVGGTRIFVSVLYVARGVFEVCADSVMSAAARAGVFF